MTHKRLLALGGLILLAGCTCNRLADAPPPPTAWRTPPPRRAPPLFPLPPPP